MDADILGGIRVAGEAKQILFRAAHCGTSRRRAQAASAAVPVDLRFQVAVLGNIRGEFVPGHDGQANVIAGHRVEHVGAVREHLPHNPGGLAQREVRDVRRANDGQAVEVDELLIERRKLEVAAHRVRHGADGLGSRARDGKAEQEREES